MLSFFLFSLALAMLFYVAVIYTSQAMLLLAFASAVLLMCSFVYLLAARTCLLGRVIIPIPVADADKPVTVQVRICNKGVLPVFHAKIALEVRNSFERRGSVNWQRVSKILPGENQTEFVLLLEQAGNYEVFLRQIRIYDLAGLCFINKRFPSKKNVQVMPALLNVPIFLTHYVRNFFGDADVYDEEKAGHDNSEVFQIRPYAAGDKLQSVHWKLSAKADELMVKESALPKACPVVLLLDYRADKSGRRGNFGTFLEIGASLSFSLMDAGCPHYVAWYEEQTKDIARIRVDDDESFYLFLSYYLKEQGRKVPKSVQLLYDEKYRAERYLYAFRLTEKLAVYKNDEIICELKQDSYKKQLGGLEIVL